MERKRLGLYFFVTFLFATPLYATEPLPGTKPLKPIGNVVATQLKQVTDYFQRRLSAARTICDQAWKPNFASKAAYQQSISRHRVQLRIMLGLTDESKNRHVPRLEKLGKEVTCRIERVTIPITDGLSARGLLFTPRLSGKKPAVIVCPDADTWPEQLVGLADEEPAGGWLTTLIRRGVVVYVPQSIERLQDHPYCQQTKNKDRRWILYRLGYCVGRTMPGFDVQEALAAVKFIANQDDVDADCIALAGVGQGGMTALMAGSLDRRVKAVAIGDYFDNRDRCWDEPIDRRLRDKLLHFGDAELAA